MLARVNIGATLPLWTLIPFAGLLTAIAEEAGVPMPSFLGYLGWSFAVLIPLFVLITWIFL